MVGTVSVRVDHTVGGNDVVASPYAAVALLHCVSVGVWPPWACIRRVIRSGTGVVFPSQLGYDGGVGVGRFAL